jgi:chromosome segregation ATPase
MFVCVNYNGDLISINAFANLQATKEIELLAEKVSEEKSAKEAKEAELVKMTEELNCQNEVITLLRKDLKRMEKNLEDEMTGREELKQTLSTTTKECVDLIQQVQEVNFPGCRIYFLLKYLQFS